MSNFKRRKSRRKVKCSICTPYRNGNSYLPSKEVASRQDFREQVRDA